MTNQNNSSIRDRQQTELGRQIEYIQKQIVSLEEQWLRANTLYRVIYRAQIAGWQLQLRVAIQEMNEAGTVR